MTYRKRAFTALVAGALALPFLATPALAGHGGPQAGPPQNIAEFCTNPFQEAFVDVAPTDVFALAIQCIATAGRETGQPITVGGPEGSPSNQYGPNRGVLRGQMASFIARMLDAAEQRDRQQSGGVGQIQALPGYDGSNSFVDVPNNFVHVQNINRLADAGVVLGGPGGRASNIYAPNEFISRAQMASFINRAAAYAMSQNPNNSGRGTGYTATSNFFVDSGEIAVHQANINGLASVGIVVGVQPESEHRYAPRANVTRAQMAGFISRTLSQLYDDNRVHSLLETLTGNANAESRQDRNVADGDTRNITFTNLDPNVEYRVTLVTCANVTRGGNDLVTFARNADGTANTGNPTSRITGTGNGGSGGPIAPTATTTTTGNSQFTVTIQNDANTAECVVAVIYRNGSAGKTLAEGGTRPQLEVDGNGRPVEFFGISGDTTFAAAEQEPPPPTQGQGDVELDDRTVAPGDSIVATVSATQPIESVTVSGDCVEGGEQTFSPDTGDNNREFEVEIDIAADAEEGRCDLTFEFEFENGTSDTVTDFITVEAGEPVAGEATIASDSTVATQGGTATFTATADQPITSVRVSGDCVQGGSVTRTTDAEGRAGFQVVVPIRGDAATGPCELTFVTTFDNRTTDTDMVTIQIQAAQGQATITSDSNNVATQGGTATFTANADRPITSVRVSGDCVQGGSVTRTTDAEGRAGFQVVVPIRGDATLGDCTLMFVTTFDNGTTDTDMVTIQIQDAAPRITDAFVATDTAATGTANSGDVFRLIFSESVATDGGTATQTATFQDAEGDTFTVQCGPAGQTVTMGNTAATCTLSADGRTLDITLTQDPETTRSSGTASTAGFPLTIIAINGFVDQDGGTALQVDVANSPDRTVDRSAGRTVDTA